MVVTRGLEMGQREGRDQRVKPSAVTRMSTGDLRVTIAIARGSHTWHWLRGEISRVLTPHT